MSATQRPNPGTSAQFANIAAVGVKKNGTLVGTEQNVNLIEGTNVTLTVTDNPGVKTVDVTINATGGGGYPPDISARASLAAPFAANVATPIQRDTLTYDTAGFFNFGANASLITIPQTGKYQLGANWLNTVNSGNALTISINGVVQAGPAVAGNDSTDAGFTDQLQLNAGDIIRIIAQNTGGGAGTGTCVWIKRVA